MEKYKNQNIDCFSVKIKNELESYLYNARNTLQEDKVKEKLGSSVEEGLKTVEEGLDWLQDNPMADANEYKEKMKYYEEKIRPIMMKLYSGAGGMDGSAEGSMPGMHGQESTPGPRVEEVD